MTCIVGLVSENGQIVMGGDSAAVDGLTMTLARDPKVFQFGLEFVFGYSGSFRIGQLLQYAFSPSVQKESQSDLEYLVTDFCQEWRQVLELHGAIQGRTGTDEMEAEVLIGYRGSLYQMDGDFQITPNRHGYAAVGSGSDIALGALAASGRVGNASKRVRLALEASALHCAGVRGPFSLVVLKV